MRSAAATLCADGNDTQACLWPVGDPISNFSGMAFVEELAKLAWASGAAAVYPSANTWENDVVKPLYARIGFRRWRTFETSPGRLMNELRLEIG